MRVLVAEDSSVELRKLENTVEQLGHKCLVATDGLKAWELFTREEPDVVISDWTIPGLGGPDLCRRIRAHGALPDPYLAFLTVSADKQAALARIQAGADDCLLKPVDQTDLQICLITAERMLDLRRVLASQTAELAKTRRELSEHARVDTLTGLRNSVRLQEDLRAFRGRAARYGHRYAIAVCDLDQYAAYNERYGRPAGDEVVRAIGHVFSDECRTGDEIYRDGAQFLLVLPEQSVPQATGVVERIRCRIQGLQLEHSSNQPADVVTVSVGVAMLDPESRADERSILGPAQAYLSMAKERGRNRVVASESTLT